MWKFGDFQSGLKSAVFRGLDEVTSRLKSGGKFNVQTRNELKKVEGLNKSAKKDFDIFAKALDGEMYKLVNAGLMTYYLTQLQMCHDILGRCIKIHAW